MGFNSGFKGLNGGHFMYRQVQDSHILRSAHTVHSRVFFFCGSHKNSDYFAIQQ